MKRLITIILLLNFMLFSFSSSTEILGLHLQPKPKKQKLFSSYRIHSFALTDRAESQFTLRSRRNDIPSSQVDTERKEVKLAHLRLGGKESFALSPEESPELTVPKKNKKNYLKAALEVTGVNLVVWAYDRYLLGRGWANISLNTVFENFKNGYAWDDNSFQCNQFEHPYHGAMYHSVARSNGLSFLESLIYTFFGSSMWEFILEAHRPSTNDTIMTTFAGMPLGEVLFRVSELILDDSSKGIERVVREFSALLINPSRGFRMFTGEAFRTGNASEKHHYQLNFPVGPYTNFTDKTDYMIAAHLEYQDGLKKNARIKPYDWFTCDFRLGFDEGLHDVELITTGFLVGKKFKNGLVGFFGVFDYIDTTTTEKMSAFGLGPGLVTDTISESGLFFKSSAVLAGIFGGSSSSLELNYYHFGNGTDEPYFLGPGMMGRINLEAGKKGLGSIYSGFSQYWVHSIFTEANEFLGILAVGLKIDLPLLPPLGLEYDYYIRHATHHEERFSDTKEAIRATLVLEF